MWLCMLVVWPSILCNDQCYCVYKILARTFRTVIVCTSPNFVVVCEETCLIPQFYLLLALILGVSAFGSTFLLVTANFGSFCTDF